MDDTVGKLLRVLESTGQSTRTLVVFTSDNGAHWMPSEVQQTGHRAHGPWRGMKSDALEGGHRVPLLVRWPGVVRPGSTSPALVGLNDLLATVADIVERPLPKGAGPDSVSFAPVLRGESEQSRDALVLHSISGVFAVRRGDWKLIAGPGSGGWSAADTSQSVQLYNLRQDPGETNNLAGTHGERVRELESLLSRLRQ
jgi:arylsulfatase A-like enzyme